MKACRSILQPGLGGVRVGGCRLVGDRFAKHAGGDVSGAAVGVKWAFLCLFVRKNIFCLLFIMYCGVFDGFVCLLFFLLFFTVSFARAIAARPDGTLCWTQRDGSGVKVLTRTDEELATWHGAFLLF